MRRRTWVAGLGLGAAGIGAGLVYRAAPSFWKRWVRQQGVPVEPPPHRPTPQDWPDRGVHAAWIGHSTVLLKIDGFTVLTDPVFSTHIGLGLGPFTLGLKRLVDPALALQNLPHIDVVLLSHAHMDHFDLPTLRALERRKPAVVTARATSDLLRVDRYSAVHEIGWGETVRVGPLTFKGLEVNHWGARMRTDTWRGYNGYLITSDRRRILFAGDTADTHAFRAVGGAELALMPIGAYNPWIRYHCSPEQALRMVNEARGEIVLPLHHRTFVLSQEQPAEPIERLLTAVGRDTHRVALRAIGQEFHL